MSSDFIDETILSIAKANHHQMKVAMLIAKVSTALDGSIGDEARVQEVAGRIEALVADGRLAGFGDLKDWRHSEVKFLPR